jgi:hypothetical protein
MARLGFSPALSFRVIDDLEPYFAGYRSFVLGLIRLLPQRMTCGSCSLTGGSPRAVSARLASAHNSHFRVGLAESHPVGATEQAAMVHSGVTACNTRWCDPG